MWEIIFGSAIMLGVVILPAVFVFDGWNVFSSFAVLININAWVIAFYLKGEVEEKEDSKSIQDARKTNS